MLIPKSKRDAATAALAGLAAVVLGVLPWRVWMAIHDVPNQASLGRVADPSFLLDHARRVPEVAAYLAFKALDPRAWLLVLPIALLALAFATPRLNRVEARFAIGVVVAAFLGLVYAYWSTPLDLHYQLTTSARRTVTGVVFLCAALAPLLAGRAAPAARRAAPAEAVRLA